MHNSVLKKISYTAIILALLFSNLSHADELPLKENDIPWGLAKDKFLTQNQGDYIATPINKKDLLKKKQAVAFDNLNFTKSVRFNDQKELSQVAYIINSNKTDIKGMCDNLHQYLTQRYDGANKAVNANNEFDKNTNYLLSQFVWDTLKDTTIVLNCKSFEKDNFAIITLQPKWQVLDCPLYYNTYYNSRKGPKKDEDLVLYLDNWNHSVRVLNQGIISFELKSEFSPDEISFATDNNVVNGRIVRKTGQIYVTVTDDAGKYGKKGSIYLDSGICNVR